MHLKKKVRIFPLRKDPKMHKILTAVSHEINNLESSVVVQELELAINLAL